MTSLSRDIVGCEPPVDLYIVYDASGSIGRTRFDNFLKFSIHLVDKMDISTTGDRMAAILFQTNVTVTFDLAEFTDSATLKVAISEMQYLRGTTNTAGALRELRGLIKQEQEARRPVRNVVLVLTDGLSDDPAATLREAMWLRAGGATVLTVAIGELPWLLMDELQGMATEPRDRNSWVYGSYEELEQDMPSLMATICNSM